MGKRGIYTGMDAYGVVCRTISNLWVGGAGALLYSMDEKQLTPFMIYTKTGNIEHGYFQDNSITEYGYKSEDYAMSTPFSTGHLENRNAPGDELLKKSSPGRGRSEGISNRSGGSSNPTLLFS